MNLQPQVEKEGLGCRAQPVEACLRNGSIEVMKFQPDNRLICINSSRISQSTHGNFYKLGRWLFAAEIEENFECGGTAPIEKLEAE